VGEDMSLSRWQKRSIKKEIEKIITPKFLGKIWMEVVDDIVSGKESREQMISPSWTVQDIMDVGHFWCVHEIVNEMIACIIGRTVRLYLEHKSTVNVFSDPEFLIELMASTDHVQHQTVNMIISAADVTNAKIDHEKMKQLLVKRTDFVQSRFAGGRV